MRILFFARRKKSMQSTGHLAAGLRAAGHDVRMVRYGFWSQFVGEAILDRYLRVFARVWTPDIVLVWKDCISPGLMAAFSNRYHCIVYCIDWFEEAPESICRRARLADLFLLSHTGQFDMYRKAGIDRIAWLPQACDTDAYRPAASAGERFHSDVGFIGSPSSRGFDRSRLLERIDEEFDLKIWGPRWSTCGQRFRHAFDREIYPAEYAQICAGARIVLGCDISWHVTLYFSNRLWLTLGCGGFYLTNYLPQLETLFENHRHLVWYHSPEECLELIRHYLPLEDERRRIAKAGLELVRSKHTYFHRANSLAEIVARLSAKV